jgi:hypothetical protein
MLYSMSEEFLPSKSLESLHLKLVTNKLALGHHSPSYPKYLSNHCHHQISTDNQRKLDLSTTKNNVELTRKRC